MPWKLAMGEVDGEPVVIILQRATDTWTPYSVVRLDVAVSRSTALGTSCIARG
jgi:hypothetical protein